MRLPLLALAVAGMSCTLIAGESIVGSRGHALTINDAVELALKQNPSILGQIQQLKVQKGLVFQAQARLLPQLTAATNYSQTDSALSPSVSSRRVNFDLLAAAPTATGRAPRSSPTPDSPLVSLYFPSVRFLEAAVAAHRIKPGRSR